MFTKMMKLGEQPVESKIEVTPPSFDLSPLEARLSNLEQENLKLKRAMADSLVFMLQFRTSSEATFNEFKDWKSSILWAFIAVGIIGFIGWFR